MDKKSEKFKDLNQEIRSCRKCRLWKTRTHALPGEGDVSSDMILIAQAPGETEDEENRMFVGPSGKELDCLLSVAGISRDEIFMTNLLRCMLPDYRKPRQDEIEACSTYLDREIELLDPNIIVPLGYFSTRYIFNKYHIREKLEFPEVCGEVFSLETKTIFPLGHPAAILYDESVREEMAKHYKKLGNLTISEKINFVLKIPLFLGRLFKTLHPS